MNNKNPYPEHTPDEASGIQVLNPKHQAWEEGHKAATCRIYLVMRLGNAMVAVFNGDGEQIPDYQGKYEEVRERILEDAPPGAVFYSEDEGIVSREKW